MKNYRFCFYILFSLLLFSFGVRSVYAEDTGEWETPEPPTAETETDAAPADAAEENEEETIIVPTEDNTEPAAEETINSAVPEGTEAEVPTEDAVPTEEEPAEIVTAEDEAQVAAEELEISEEMTEPAEAEPESVYSGFVTVDEQVLYYDPESHESVKGEKEIEGYTYYFDDETGVMTTGWKQNEENTAYYDELGHRLYGLQNIGDTTYYFDTATGFMQKKQKKLNGFYYYFDDETGAMVTGWKDIPEQSKRVYYDGEGHMLYGFQDIDDGKYYFNQRTGGMEKNQEKIGGYYYYFDDETGVMVTGWKDISEQNKTVYYNSDGHMLYGFQDIDEARYYFHLSTGAVSRNQKKIDGEYYYFDDETAVMITGWKEIPEQNKTVYYDAEGRMYHGFHTVDGIKCYFDAKTGGLAKNQKKIDGYYYYFDDETGEMYTGWKEIPSQNKRVYYGTDGRMYHGFHTVDGIKYYFDARTGGMARNQQKINGYYYYFDDETGEMITGWKDIPSQKKRVYYDKNGRMVYGTYTIDSIQYVFEHGSGALIGNFVSTSRGKQFRFKDGTLASGQKKIDNNYYYFDESTKIMVTGFKRISSQNKTVFYDSNGIMKHENFWYDGDYYLVSRNSGAIKLGPSDGIVYYSQLSPAWAGLYYGGWMFGGTGCGCSSIAMALSSLKGYSIDPEDVADFLYALGVYNNRGNGVAGSTGSANLYAADHWDVECDHIVSYDELDTYLKGGVIVTAIVGPGTFCPQGVTHEILLYGYSDGATRVYDPLGNRSSGWHSIDTIWSQQSTHWMDTDAGTPFFAFYK